MQASFRSVGCWGREVHVHSQMIQPIIINPSDRCEGEYVEYNFCDSFSYSLITLGLKIY